jgi:hypothetical protein
LREQAIIEEQALFTMEQKAVNTAPIKWAQRSDCLYLTVDLHGKIFVSRLHDVSQALQ